MTDTIEFEIALKRAGLTKKKVAQSLGISEMGLYQKVNNITEFKASEISKLYDLLNLSNLAEQQKIFLPIELIINQQQPQARRQAESAQQRGGEGMEFKMVAIVLIFVTWAIQIYRDESDGKNIWVMFIALGIWLK